jgi:hypothetical protein
LRRHDVAQDRFELGEAVLADHLGPLAADGPAQLGAELIDRPAALGEANEAGAPVLDFEPYIIRLCGAANQRNLGDLTGPRALLYVAVLVREFRCTRAPGRLLSAGLPWLAALRRLLGCRTI